MRIYDLSHAKSSSYYPVMLEFSKKRCFLLCLRVCKNVDESNAQHRLYWRLSIEKYCVVRLLTELSDVPLYLSPVRNRITEYAK